MTIARLLAHNQVRYLLAGAGAFVIEYAIFIVLMSATQALYFANSVSFGIGILAGFILHKLWSFKGNHRLPVKHQAWIYLVIVIVNLSFTNIVIGLATDVMGMPPLIGKLVALMFIIVWNYLLYRHIIFRLAKKSDMTETEL